MTEKQLLKYKEEVLFENQEEINKVFSYIVLAFELDEINQWAEEISTELVEEFKNKEKLQQQNNQGRGLFRYFT